MGWFPPRWARWLGSPCAASQVGSRTSRSVIKKANRKLGKRTNARKIGPTGEESRYTGAADKAVNLVGCKSPHHQLPGRVVSISDVCGGNDALSCSDVKASAA